MNKLNYMKWHDTYMKWLKKERKQNKRFFNNDEMRAYSIAHTNRSHAATRSGWFYLLERSGRYVEQR